jgi:hypothetical protein
MGIFSGGAPMAHGSRLHVASIVAALLLPFDTSAQEVAVDPDAPDFAFVFVACRTVGSSLGPPIKVAGGFNETSPTPHTTACSRSGKKTVDCITVFKDSDARPIRHSLRITLEASQLFIMESEGGGDWLIAKPATGRVISTTRMLSENFAAMKTCHGVYLTGDEFRNMAAKNNR